MKVTGPNGQRFTVLPDGRKMDEDGFICASGTPGLRSPLWFCVSVKISPDKVSVRDTKDPTKKTLEYTHPEWTAFIEGVKKGEFDLQK